MFLTGLSKNLEAVVTRQQDDGPKDIGGWLILPILSAIGTVLLTAYNFVITLGVLSGEGLTILRDSFPGALALMIASSVAGLCLVAYVVYCLKLVFTEDHRAPRAMITFYLALVGASVLDAAGIIYIADQFRMPNLADEAPRDGVRAVVLAVVWISYFLKSKRVRNTFVKRALS